MDYKGYPLTKEEEYEKHVLPYIMNGIAKPFPGKSDYELCYNRFKNALSLPPGATWIVVPVEGNHTGYDWIFINEGVEVKRITVGVQWTVEQRNRYGATMKKAIPVYVQTETVSCRFNGALTHNTRFSFVDESGAMFSMLFDTNQCAC